MSEEFRVSAALVTAIGAGITAVVCAVITWLRTRAAIQLKSRLELDAQGYSHTLTRQLEQLKAQFQLELKNVEIREQMRANLSLKLFEADEQRVLDALQTMRDCYHRANEVPWLVKENNGHDGFDRARELASIMSNRGALLPAEIKPALFSVRSEILKLARADANDIDGIFGHQQARIHEAMSKLEQAVGNWRQSRVEQLLGSGNPSQRRGLPVP